MRLRWKRLLVAAGGALAAFWLFVPVVPFDAPLSTVVLDRDGELLGASIAADGQWRFGVASAVPEKFAAAITCFEDRRFYWHPGVDPMALGRAALSNVRERRVVSGGSTLTMQVVRLARKGRPRTLSEKAIESVLALRLSLSLSKRQVLGLYAAYAPFGGNTVGLDAAAWRYFGRDAKHLSWAETATLAVLPNAPALVHPGRNRELLLAKRNRLLDTLRARGAIDALSADLAKREPLPPAPAPLPMLAPHLVARAGQERSGRRFRAGDESPWVRTTLRKELQARAGEIVARHRKALADNGVRNAAALVVDVPTRRGARLRRQSLAAGHGRAGRARGRRARAAQHRQRAEAAALRFDARGGRGAAEPARGRRAHPHRRLPSRELRPRLRGRRAGGAGARALAERSRRAPAARARGRTLHRSAAAPRPADAGPAGRPLRPGADPGRSGGHPLGRHGVYAGLARSAQARTPDEARAAFFEATYRTTQRAARAESAPLGPAASYLTLQAMLEVERPGEELAWRAFSSARKVAWKTGTSYGFRDAWAVGVTPRVAIGVWAGNASGEGRAGLTGHSAAAPILFDLVGGLPASGWFARPESGLEDVDVCARSGMRAGAQCETRRAELVPKAGLDSAPCSFCRLVHADAALAWQVHADCEPLGAIRAVSWFVLPPALETYYRRLHADYRPPPPFRPDCRAALSGAQSASLSFVYPREGAYVYVPVEMDGSLGRVVFEAAHRDASARVFWHLDDEYAGETVEAHQLALAPRPGRHRLVLVDERGETVERRFTAIGRGARSSATLPSGPVVQLVRTAGS